MKILYLILWLVWIIVLLILYFQNIIISSVPLRFFTSRSIDIRLFLLFVYIVAVFSWVFLALAVTSFMKWDGNIDDWFEL